MRTSTMRGRLLPALVVVVLALSWPLASAHPQATETNVSELGLSETLIKEFLQVIYFTDGGRFHFKEYSTCSYEFIQNPTVSIEDGIVKIGAEYYRRSGTEALGGCVGGPGTNTIVTLSARLAPAGRAVALEIFEVKTESLPRLTATLLDVAGVKLPMTHQFNVMDALNRTLQDNQPFGIAELEIHEVLVEDESVRLRMTVDLGIW